MDIQAQPQAGCGMKSLIGKVALVTGSTSGIGLGIARAFAAEGVQIVLNGFGAAADIARTRDEIASQYGVKVSYSPADMNRPDSVADMFAATLADVGRLDILVNTPESSMSRRSISFRWRSGTRSWESICRRRFTPCGLRCQRCAKAGSAASLILPPPMGWSLRPTRRPMSPPSTASSA
jgi:hypothetical protein